MKHLLLIVALVGGGMYWAISNSTTPGISIAEMQQLGPAHWMRSGKSGCRAPLLGPIKRCQSERSEYHFLQSGWQSHLATIASGSSYYGSFFQQTKMGFTNYPINDYPSIESFNHSIAKATRYDVCDMSVTDTQLIYKCENAERNQRRQRKIVYDQPSGSIMLIDDGRPLFSAHINHTGRLLEERHYYPEPTRNGITIMMVRTHTYNYSNPKKVVIERSHHYEYGGSWFTKQKLHLQDWWNNTNQAPEPSLLYLALLKPDQHNNPTQIKLTDTLGSLTTDVINIKYEYWD